MNLTETAALLTLAAAYDQRRLGETDVRAWQELLADVDAADAMAAVKAHYRDHTERLMPAHVRDLVAATRRRRLEQAGTAALLPSVDPDDPAYFDELRARRDQAAVAEAIAHHPAGRALPPGGGA